MPTEPRQPPQGGVLGSERPLLKISEPNISPEATSLVSEVLLSGSLVQGERALAFEQALGEFLQGPLDEPPFVALVSSGTAALHLALLALELPPGSGVLVPNFTFPATINAVLFAGLTPVIAEVSFERYVLTEAHMIEAIEGSQARGVEVRALLPVHEFGQPVCAEALARVAARYELKVIEDAACALGASVTSQGRALKVGTLGELGCFSFHPRKTLTTGEGGAVVTRSRALYERVCALRSHGMVRSEVGVSFEGPGLNYRLTDFQAALGLSQLPQLAAWIEQRRALVVSYHERLAGLSERCGLGLPPLSEGHSWQTFMVTLPEGVERAQVIHTLRERGVESNIGAQVLSEQPYVRFYLGSWPLSESRALHHRSLALPLCERYGEVELQRVVSALEGALKGALSF